MRPKVGNITGESRNNRCTHHGEQYLHVLFHSASKVITLSFDKGPPTTNFDAGPLTLHATPLDKGKSFMITEMKTK